MMLRVLYLLFGVGLFGSTVVGETRGWFRARPATVTNVPQSIRDNPGAYRALYSGVPRSFGGK